MRWFDSAGRRVPRCFLGLGDEGREGEVRDKSVSGMIAIAIVDGYYRI